jgi:hypothetical protein
MVLLVVCGFYGFLERHELVPFEQTRPILDALTPYVEPATERLTARVDEAERREATPSMLN